MGGERIKKIENKRKEKKLKGRGLRKEAVERRKRKRGTEQGK